MGSGEASARTDAAIHRHKKRPEDFTLWLPAEPGREYSWESPWGRGWPGWHIECAAMAVKYLGAGFDVHVGGIDLRFPHHENSRAMAMTAMGGRFASVWMHAAHLLVEGRKMSKSLKNEFTFSDLEVRGVSPLDFRYYCLTIHYRSPMNFTWQGQKAAARAFSRLKGALSRPSERGRADADAAGEFRRRFRDAVEDDLNLPLAVGVVHEAAHAGLPAEKVRELAAEWESVLGLGLLPGEEARKTDGVRESGHADVRIPPDVAVLVLRREAARGGRDFSEADALRARIREAGYEVIDAGGGPPMLKKI
jgi:cysteinyl-tRNA synthetase